MTLTKLRGLGTVLLKIQKSNLLPALKRTFVYGFQFKTQFLTFGFPCGYATLIIQYEKVTMRHPVSSGAIDFGQHFLNLFEALADQEGGWPRNY